MCVCWWYGHSSPPQADTSCTRPLGGGSQGTLRGGSWWVQLWGSGGCVRTDCLVTTFDDTKWLNNCCTSAKNYFAELFFKSTALWVVSKSISASNTAICLSVHTGWCTAGSYSSTVFHPSWGWWGTFWWCSSSPDSSSCSSQTQITWWRSPCCWCSMGSTTVCWAGILQRCVWISWLPLWRWGHLVCSGKGVAVFIVSVVCCVFIFIMELFDVVRGKRWW